MHHLQLKEFARCISVIASGRQTNNLPDRQLLQRFATDRDQDAFTVLVKRHGQMVLRVCRRVLRQEQDAEDAFRAIFLVLSRNSSSIRKTKVVASWLHGVAHRNALQLAHMSHQQFRLWPNRSVDLVVGSVCVWMRLLHLLIPRCWGQVHAPNTLFCFPIVLGTHS
jgi:hypothetical protein